MSRTLEIYWKPESERRRRPRHATTSTSKQRYPNKWQSCIMFLSVRALFICYKRPGNISCRLVNVSGVWFHLIQFFLCMAVTQRHRIFVVLCTLHQPLNDWIIWTGALLGVCVCVSAPIFVNHVRPSTPHDHCSPVEFSSFFVGTPGHFSYLPQIRWAHH